jgi:hypothetical protein
MDERGNIRAYSMYIKHIWTLDAAITSFFQGISIVWRGPHLPIHLSLFPSFNDDKNYVPLNGWLTMLFGIRIAYRFNK